MRTSSSKPPPLSHQRLSRYYVEFSKPSKEKPIPEGTVKVFFNIICGSTPDNYMVEFYFENESLVHKMDSTNKGADPYLVSPEDSTMRPDMF